jgi:hypothetical protein
MDHNNLVDLNNKDYTGRSVFDHCLCGPRLRFTNNVDPAHNSS